MENIYPFIVTYFSAAFFGGKFAYY